MGREVDAFRVHAPGVEKTVKLLIVDERLHASGVFSNVYSAKLFQPIREKVAIKKTWPIHGSSVISPEIYYLARIKHPSVITLLYHFTIAVNNEICHCMVFDFLPTDLSKLRAQKTGRRLPLLDVKLYSFQMFSAIDYVNYLGIAHRDVKPSNLIVDDEKGILKLADFGNAKLLRKHEFNTPYQVTRYYRAPELIFGSTRYTTAIDLWACACVVIELITGKVFLQGKSNDDQARLVIDTFGYPTKEQCSAMRISRPRHSRKSPRSLNKVLQGWELPDCLKNLLRRLLRYEPLLRLKGHEVIANEFFNELREKPARSRESGTKIPNLDYDIYQQDTQSQSDSEEEEEEEGNQ